MADRYWVGGTGTWDATTTTNWSATSGGGGGASVPTSADNVFFDAGSDAGGIFTVTMANSPRVCNNFTASSLDFTMTLAGTSIGLTVSGSLDWPATNFTRTYTGTTTFNATTTGKTVTARVAFGGAVTFDGVGGGWTLGFALDCGANTITLTNGTFDTSSSGNYAVTAYVFSSSNSNTRTINLNGSTITLNGLAVTVWNMSPSTNATLNAGTSTITITFSNIIFNGGGLSYYNVQFTATSASALFQVQQTNTFNNFTVSTIAAAGISRLIFIASQTINGTLTVNGSNGNRRLLVQSQNIGTTITLTCAAIASITDVDFRDVTIAGAASPLSGTRLGNCNGNSNITFDAGKTVYWNLAAGGNWSATAWATGSGGSVADTNFPLAQDTVIVENTGLDTSATITINTRWNIGTLNSSTRTNAMTLASGSNTPLFYGNFTYGSGVTPTGTGTYTFANRSTKTLNSGGKTFTQPVTIDAPSGSVQLVTNNLTLQSTLTTTLTQGTLDLNNFTLSTGLFNASNSNTRTIAFGTGQISCTGTGTVWTTATITGLTTTGTQVVNVTSAGSTAITVSTGALSEANSISYNFTGGTYALTFLDVTNYSARSVNFTGYAGTLAELSDPAAAPVIIYGDLTLSAGMTLTASTTGNGLSFRKTSGTSNITTNGKIIPFILAFNGVGGTFVLQDNLTTSGATSDVFLNNGTLDLNGKTLTPGSTFVTGTGTKNLTFNGGTLVCSLGVPLAFNNFVPTGFTTTAGTGTGTISMTAATAKTFVGGGSTYNCTVNQGGAGALTITGSNTFSDITNTYSATGATSILFTAATTSTFTNWNASGSAGNLLTIGSVTAASHTLSKASGIVTATYLSISRSTATGGAGWYAGANSTDSGNNSGWLFTALAVASRITSAGVLSIAGEFDEVTQATIRLTSSFLYSSEFDEYTLQGAGGGLAKRETAAGKIQVTGSFDEYNKP